MKRARWKRWLIGAALYLGAVAVGLGSAWWVVKKTMWNNSTVGAGVWKTNLRAGSPDADMYTRAFIAVNALLALGRDETMYFLAATDDAGHALRAECNYRVSGTPPPARWWSITAYAQDLFLFDAANHHYSLNGTSAAVDATGRFAMTVGPAAQGDTYWLPTKGSGKMVLALRLYNPAPSLQAAPGSLPPPTITALGACP